jgi:hypothetical protein
LPARQAYSAAPVCALRAATGSGRLYLLPPPARPLSPWQEYPLAGLPAVAPSAPRAASTRPVRPGPSTLPATFTSFLVPAPARLLGSQSLVGPLHSRPWRPPDPSARRPRFRLPRCLSARFLSTSEHTYLSLFVRSPTTARLPLPHHVHHAHPTRFLTSTPSACPCLFPSHPRPPVFLLPPFSYTRALSTVSLRLLYPPLAMHP